MIGASGSAQSQMPIEGLSAAAVNSLSSHLSSIGASSAVPRLNAPLSEDDRLVATAASSPRTMNALIAAAGSPSAAVKIGAGSPQAGAGSGDGAFANLNAASSLSLSNALGGPSSSEPGSPLSSIGSVAVLGLQSSNALEILAREPSANSLRIGK